jgi:hypothetical protein
MQDQTIGKSIILQFNYQCETFYVLLYNWSSFSQLFAIPSTTNPGVAKYSYLNFICEHLFSCIRPLTLINIFSENSLFITDHKAQLESMPNSDLIIKQRLIGKITTAKIQCLEYLNYCLNNSDYFHPPVVAPHGAPDLSLETSPNNLLNIKVPFPLIHGRARVKEAELHQLKPGDILIFEQSFAPLNVMIAVGNYDGLFTIVNSTLEFHSWQASYLNK